MLNNNFNAAITGIGHYLPEKIINNDQISRKYNIPVESVSKRSGILFRRYRTTENTSDLACKAIENLLFHTDTKINEIDYIIIGTLTPESFAPSTAAIVINKLGAINATGIDISAACSGFCYGVEIAKSFVEVGKYKKIIVCGVDVMSATLNDYDYKTGILFGDGAGAVLIEPTLSQNYIIDTKNKIIADNLSDITYNTQFSNNSPSPNCHLDLRGTRVYRNGTKYSSDIIIEYLNENGLSLSDFKYIVPHQSNLRMLQEIAAQLHIPMSKMLINVDRVGNTAAASIPICLSEYFEMGIISEGDRLLLCSFGAGYTLSVIDLIWAI